MRTFCAKDVMTRKVRSVKPETTVKEVAKFFLKHKISGAPVLDKNKKLVGMVTESDVIFRDANVHLPTVVTLFDSIIYLESPRKYEEELHKIVGGKVADIMSKKVVTIKPEASMQEMATLMQEKKCHLLPVVAAGKVIGVVGKADLVRAIAQEE